MEFTEFKTTDAYYINDSIKEFIGQKVAGLRLNISKELNSKIPQALENYTGPKGPISQYIYTKVKRRTRQDWDKAYKASRGGIEIKHLGDSMVSDKRIINQYATEYFFWFDAPHADTHIGQVGSIKTIPAKFKALMKFKDRDKLAEGWKSKKVVNVPRRVSEDVIQDMFDSWIIKNVDDVVTAAAPKAM